MADAIYAIDDFPDDDVLWRIGWIGGVGYNTSAPSDPLIDVCLAQLPAGEISPLSAQSRSSQTQQTVKIGVGLLPYIAIASVWRQQRPVMMDLAACRHRLRIDASSSRIVALGNLTSSVNAIPRSSYLFGASWPHVRRTLVVAVEHFGEIHFVECEDTDLDFRQRIQNEYESERGMETPACKNQNGMLLVGPLDLGKGVQHFGEITRTRSTWSEAAPSKKRARVKVHLRG